MRDQIHHTINKSLNELGISEFTQIQLESIPLILENSNLIALSETGSGKTLSYLIPTINKIIGLPKKDISLLIITPTKELCSQVYKVVKSMTKHNKLLSYKILGGENYNEQVREINKGQHIIVSTPGRLVDHIIKESIDLSKITSLVLDEVDIMMDMGYLPQIETIIDRSNKEKQILMFSATMSDEAKVLIDKFNIQYEMVDIKSNKPKETIEELFVEVDPKIKIPFLKFLFKKEKIRSAIIFCNTKEQAKKLYLELSQSNYKSALIEGEMSTHQRNKSLESFKRKDIQYLIATDVAARGIDIPHVNFIINFEVPLNKDSYIHRIGRTARHEKSGKAFTFFELESDEKNILRITDEIKVKKYKDFNPNLKKAK